MLAFTFSVLQDIRRSRLYEPHTLNSHCQHTIHFSYGQKTLQYDLNVTYIALTYDECLQTLQLFNCHHIQSSYEIPHNGLK